MCRRRCGVMPQRLDKSWGFCRQAQMLEGVLGLLATAISDSTCRTAWYAVCEARYV